MRRLALLALLLPGPAAATAGEAWPPVCARPAVLERVGEVLREAGRPMALEPAPIGEASTGPGRVMRCAARGRRLGYDTSRYGPWPVQESLVIRYTLELRRNGIFLRVQ